MRVQLHLLWLMATTCLVAGMAAGGSNAGGSPGAVIPPLPQRLSQTGLVRPDGAIAANMLAFSPQYPLWSDGSTKRRWISLPAGASIDAARADAWVFPPGTRLFKEFSHGRPVETRMIERVADGTWRYATYVWNADGSDALLAPMEGVPKLAVAEAPDGNYGILAEADCRACHEAAAVPPLGFSALQLSNDRDPLAPNAQARAAGELTLDDLIKNGLLKNLPAASRKPPRIAADTPTARAALGYLHANCGHCHNRSGADPLVPVGLSLAQPASTSPSATAQVLETMMGSASSYQMPGVAGARHVVEPGRPDSSVLLLRMRSRNPQTQMPPLGTRVGDSEGLALIDRWITEMPHSTEKSP